VNIKEYINTGILELYALNLLSPEEAREVEMLVEKHVELKNELSEIQDSFDSLATKNMMKSPLSEADIWKGIEASELAASNQIQNQPPSSSNPKTGNKIALNKNLFFILTSVFLLKGIIIGFLLYQQSKTTHQMDNIHQQLNVLQKDKQEIAAAKEKLEQDFHTLRSIAKQSFTLKDPERNTSSLAVVHWDAEAQSNFVDLINIPAAPKGKQYQLWAIVEGQPTSAGLIDPTLSKEGLLIEVDFISNPQAFAITLEPIGGSEQPTMDEMVVIGYT